MSVTRAADAAVQKALSHSTGSITKDDALFAGLTGADRDRAMAQFALQKQQETVAFISKAMKNDSAMATINNMR